MAAQDASLILTPLVESVNLENKIASLTIDELKLAICNLGDEPTFALEQAELIKEFLWKIGETKELFETFCDYKKKCWESDYEFCLKQEMSEPLQSKLKNYLGMKTFYCCLHHGIRFNCSHDLEEVAKGGNAALCQWVVKNGAPLKGNICFDAAKHGHLEVLKWGIKEKWLFYRDYTDWEKGCMAAAEFGYLEILKWALHNGYWNESVSRRICYYAASSGHIDIIQWARVNNCDWDGSVCDVAATGGHVHVLEWVCQNGCPFGLYVCENAARQGHILVLEWAIENGYSLTSSVCDAAVENKQRKVIKWLREHGCENSVCECGREWGSGKQLFGRI